MNRAITVLLVAFGLSVTLTLASERLARRFGLVARPVADRWHRQTIPMLGGIAIVVGTLVPAVVVARTSANFVALAIVATAMALVGLVDDVRRLSPQASCWPSSCSAASCSSSGSPSGSPAFRSPTCCSRCSGSSASPTRSTSSTTWTGCRARSPS